MYIFPKMWSRNRLKIMKLFVTAIVTKKYQKGTTWEDGRGATWERRAQVAFSRQFCWGRDGVTRVGWDSERGTSHSIIAKLGRKYHHGWIYAAISSLHVLPTLIKKKIKFSSYIRKFRMEQLQSHMTNGLLTYWEALPHIWLCNCSLWISLTILFSFLSVYSLWARPACKWIKYSYYIYNITFALYRYINTKAVAQKLGKNFLIEKFYTRGVGERASERRIHCNPFNLK